MKFLAYAVWMCLLVGVLLTISARAQEVVVTGRVTIVGSKRPLKQADNSDVVIWLTPVGASHVDSRKNQSRAGRTRLRLLQKSKRFEPRVLVVQSGTAVEFPNLDPFFHNVFSLFNGKRFDLGLYEGGATRAVRFDRPGVAYIFCNIHPQMSAVVVAVNTPYFTISDSRGAIEIPNVPPGRYALEIWCEKALPETLRALRREITVTPNSTSIGSLRLTESGSLFLAHKNKYGREYDAPTPPSPLYEQP
jgi:plastocyanin